MWINRNVRSGQTAFCTFLIWLSAGTSGWRNAGVRFIWGFLLSFGVMVCHSVLDFSMRNRLWFRWPAGRKTAGSIPRAATQTPGYLMELKLVWSGDFRNQFWVLCFSVPGGCLASVFQIWRWSDVGIGERGEAECFRYFGLFCLLIFV